MPYLRSVILVHFDGLPTIRPLGCRAQHFRARLNTLGSFLVVRDLSDQYAVPAVHLLPSANMRFASLTAFSEPALR